jgi:hypothetical protein
VKMTHKDCGGELYENPSMKYEYEGGVYPAIMCRKCNREVLGDAEVEIEGLQRGGHDQV